MNARPSRETLERAVDALDELLGVHSVGIHKAAEKSHSIRPAVHYVSLVCEYERIPPRVLRELVKHDLGVQDVSPQGTQLVVTAV